LQGLQETLHREAIPETVQVFQSAMKTPDPLSFPIDWPEAGRKAWEECARRARADLGIRVSELLQGIVSAKDARIAALEKDNALLKAQLEELEESRAQK
jgi:hypothetical protein